MIIRQNCTGIITEIIVLPSWDSSSLPQFEILNLLNHASSPAQAQELASLGDKTNQVEGQVTVLVNLEAEVEELRRENAGNQLTLAVISFQCVE